MPRSSESGLLGGERSQWPGKHWLRCYMILDFIPLSLLVRLKLLNWYQPQYCHCFTSHCYILLQFWAIGWSVLYHLYSVQLQLQLFVSLVKLMSVLSTAFSPTNQKFIFILLVHLICTEYVIMWRVWIPLRKVISKAMPWMHGNNCMHNATNKANWSYCFYNGSTGASLDLQSHGMNLYHAYLGGSYK